MYLTFLKRELRNEKIEWGITPIYLMAIREQDPEVWQQFVNLINAIDDKTLDKELERSKKKKSTRKYTTPHPGSS